MEGSDGGFVDRLSLTSDRRIQIRGERLDANVLHTREKAKLNAKQKLVVVLVGRYLFAETWCSLVFVKNENGTYSFDEEGWNDVVEIYKLKNGDNIDLWSFVVEEKITPENTETVRYFILAKVD